MKSKLLAFIKDESGQTSTEYILLVAVVALIVFRFKTKATEQLDILTEGIFKSAGSVSDQIQDAVGGN